MNILAFFTNNGSPALGLNPTIRIRNVVTNALLVTDASMSEVGDGHYKYNFTTYDKDIDYSIRCDGGVLLPASERYTYAGNENYIDDISETVTEAVSGISVSAAGVDYDLIADKVWDEDTKSHQASGSFGEMINDISTDVKNISASNSDISNEITNVSTQIDSLSASNQTNFDTVNTNISNLDTKIDALSASQYDMSQDIKRLLGLTHENIFIDNPTYDSYGNMESARLRIYSDPASVGTGSNVIGTYQISAPSTAPGQFTTWRQVRTS